MEFNSSSRIEVKDQNLGTFELSVTDFRLPQWSGKYQTGRLSIYSATMHGKPMHPCYGLIYVISEQDDPSLDCVGFTMYHARVTFPEAIEHLVTLINEQYVERVMVIKNHEQPTIQ